MTDDSQLLARYANEGDVRSLSELVAAHTRWLMAYLRGALPTESDAEDAFQEAWMRVIRFCGSYRGGSVRGYLARVARSVVTDRFRRGGPPSISLDTSSDEEDAPSADLADGAPSPGEAFELRATSEDVRRDNPPLFQREDTGWIARMKALRAISCSVILGRGHRAVPQHHACGLNSR